MSKTNPTNSKFAVCPEKEPGRHTRMGANDIGMLNLK